MYNVLAGTSSPSLDWINKVAPVLDVQAWELLVVDESVSCADPRKTTTSKESEASLQLAQGWCLQP